MARLIPRLSRIIPVHPATEGHDVQKLAVEMHEFLAPARQGNSNRIAVLWSHSNGFHKESLHPLIRHFVQYLRRQPQYNYSDIHCVAWDARNHGDSARLNEGTFKNTYTWFDNAMDTKQVIDQMGLRKDYNALIGVGHSFGATSMLICEFFYPKTFDGLTLIEPVIGPEIHDATVRATYPTIVATPKRRDTWNSREECLKALAPRPFWKRFHPDVLKLYVDYGMYETPEGTIKLKCPKDQEYHVFYTQHYPTAAGYRSLRALTIPVHFIYALESNFLQPSDKHMITGQTAQATIDFVPGTHMVPNETPDAIAPNVAHIVDRVFASKAKASRL